MNNTKTEPRGTELIKRYKENYSIPDEAPVTEEMILQHWELEKSLTHELLVSTPETRWDVFEKNYARLYHELDWLNKVVHTSQEVPAERRYSKWVDAIGDAPLTIYEIGSGKGAMISYLAKLGHNCTGTEITRERGEKLAKSSDNLRWVTTDGIHLDLYEKEGQYDLLLSDQVIEHFHPQDINIHFQTANKILTPSGRYIFSTPHLYTGPSDISAVFGCSVAKGMHLKEYTYREMIKIAKQSGFRHLSYAYKFTNVLKKTKLYFVLKAFGCGPLTQKKLMGNLYLKTILFFEWALGLIPSINVRKKMALFLSKVKLFNPNIFLEARKA